MSALVKIIVGALLDWGLRQIPTIVAAWERRQAKQAAAKQLTADRQRIADLVRESSTPPAPVNTGTGLDHPV